MSALPPTTHVRAMMDPTNAPPDVDDISFNDKPPEAGPELWVHRLKGAEELTCTVFGTAVRGVDTHWVAGGTQPHYKNEATCPGCKAKVRIDWKGYLHCFDWKRGRQFFLEMTPASHKALMSQIEPGKPLRGSIIRVKRSKAGNGRLSIVVDRNSRRDDKLPAEVDPRLSILRLYQLDDETEQEAPRDGPIGEEPDYSMEKPPDDV